jgi:hypothetical protein
VLLELWRGAAFPGGFSHVCAHPTLNPNPIVLQEHGALVFESRRFVELRKQTFWRQLTSNESTGMGIFYTLNVFCIQVRRSAGDSHVGC